MAKAAVKKASTSRRAPATNKTPATDKPRRVSTKAAETKAPQELVTLDPGTFVRFVGYVSETSEADRDCEKGDVLYIIAVTPSAGNNATVYTVIRGADVETYLEAESPELADVEGFQLIVQEVAPLTGRALAEAKDSYLPIPSVGKLDEIIDAADGQLVEAARDLFNDMEQNSFYLGGVLAKVRREGSYLKENGGDYEGESAWDDFCQSEFGFGGAKGGDLARQYQTFAAIPGFDPSNLADIGWSKLREIQRYVTPENVDDLLETARETTKRELSIKLVERFADENNRTAAGKAATRGGGSSVPMMTITFKLPADQHDGVLLALKEAQKVYGVSSDADALERIVVAWADEHVQSASAKKKISSKIDKAPAGAAKKPGRVKAGAAAA